MAPTMNFLFEGHDEAINTPRRHTRAPPQKVSPDHPALHGSLTPPLNCPTSKILNFSPGPTNLPPRVEAVVQARCFPSPEEKRLGSMALSHRSPEFGSILKNALAMTRQVMEIPDEYEILFTQGGGHGQFAAVPMNLCPTGSESATYIVNGTWSKRAVDEAKKYCRPTVISSLKDDGSCTSYPSLEQIQREVDPNSAFLYVCSNETVNGLELHRLLPRLACAGVPLVVDASSDFTSKPIAWRESNVGLLFACASKNIGHPGVTMVVVRKDLIGKANPFTPGFLNYETNILADNVWNTIPTFNVDVVGIVMEWILENGGVREMERLSILKSELMYKTIEQSDGFFSTPVAEESGYRSRMNVPFCVVNGDEAMTDLFLVECWERGIVGLRTITPFGKSMNLRASLYHGVAYEEVVVLTSFMKEFAARHSISKEVGATTASSAAIVSPLFQSESDASLSSDATPTSDIFEESLDPLRVGIGRLCLGGGCPMPNKEYEMLTKLSTSPDTVNDPALTWPKNMKINQYTRVSNDMFAPPMDRASPPPVLR